MGKGRACTCGLRISLRSVLGTEQAAVESRSPPGNGRPCGAARGQLRGPRAPEGSFRGRGCLIHRRPRSRTRTAPARSGVCVWPYQNPSRSDAAVGDIKQTAKVKNPAPAPGGQWASQRGTANSWLRPNAQAGFWDKNKVTVQTVDRPNTGPCAGRPDQTRLRLIDHKPHAWHWAGFNHRCIPSP